jgi:hypothetical protein
MGSCISLGRVRASGRVALMKKATGTIAFFSRVEISKGSTMRLTASLIRLESVDSIDGYRSILARVR